MANKINFDHATANAVISAMRAAADKLGAYRRLEDPLRADALNDWTGGYGDQFRNQKLPRMNGESDRLISALNNTAQAIEDAGASADRANAQHP
jgi:hypothetical protein